MKYNPVKFFLAYFAGKFVITVLGAYLGVLGHGILVPFISNEVLTATSIISTAILTIVLLKVDVWKIVERIVKRRAG